MNVSVIHLIHFTVIILNSLVAWACMHVNKSICCLSWSVCANSTSETASNVRACTNDALIYIIM